MRNFKTVCLVIIASVAVIGSILSAVYASQLSAYVEQLERSARADMVYLRGYIRRLEGELTDAIANLSEDTKSEAEATPDIESDAILETEQSDLPTDGHPEDESEIIESESESDSELETETEAMVETESETEAETEAEKAILYTLTIYNGRIGVFDATGRILCTLNVFVPSLPASDYAALLAGVPIYSQEQMWEIWDKYA